MPKEPTISFFLAGRNHPVSPASPLWRQALPLAPGLGGRDAVAGVEYGHYFQALSAFLLNPGRRHLAKALSDQLQRRVAAEEIDGLEIFLEKHGACYHPARVRAQVGEAAVNLVINGAVSAEGKAVIGREYDSLARLHRETGLDFTPKVYGLDRVRIDPGIAIPMFLGEWCRGFSEFHLFPAPSGKGLALKVWDVDSGPYFLNPDQARSLYRQAALILTCYYNIETLEQVMAWHHAAGDFVVRPLSADRVDLRLITVRNYAPMATGVDIGAEAMAEGLVLFLLGMTIRMRLDRIDGVGETVWAGEAALGAAVDGFSDALGFKEEAGVLPFGFTTGWFRYLAAHTGDDLAGMARALVAQYPGGSPDRETAASNLAGHVAEIHRCAGRFLKQESGEKSTI